MREFEINDMQKGLVAEKESIRRKLVSKWKTRFQTISGDEAVLCENTSRTINESTTSVNIAGYNNFAFKLVRRVYGNMIAKELVSVQPMTGPNGKVFYLRPEITTGNTHSDWIDMYTSMQENENWDGSNGAWKWDGSMRMARILISPFRYESNGSFSSTMYYDGGMISLPSITVEYSYPYEKQYVVSSSTFSSLPANSIDGREDTYSIYFGGSGTWANILITGSSSTMNSVIRYGVMFPKPIVPIDTPAIWTLSGSNDLITWEHIVDGTDSGDYDILDGRNVKWSDTKNSEAYRYIIFSGFQGPGQAAIGVSEILIQQEPQFTSGTSAAFAIDPTQYTKDIFCGNSISAISYAANRAYSAYGGTSGPFVHLYWKKYDSLESEPVMQKIRLNVADEDIMATTRWMKSSFTDEMAEDMYALFGLDAEDELANMIGDEMAAEIDREIIRDLIKIAPYRSEWWYDYNSTSAVTDQSYLISDPRFSNISSVGASVERLAHESLLLHIDRMDAQIRKSNIYHGANWLICSTKVGSVIESMPEHSAIVGEIIDQNKIYRTGKLRGRINVYVDPYLPDDVCLLGYNDANWDAGYIYAPYVMANTTEVNDPNGLFEKTFAFLTRYGKKVVNNKKYGRIVCTFPDWYNVTNDD